MYSPGRSGRITVNHIVILTNLRSRQPILSTEMFQPYSMSSTHHVHCTMRILHRVGGHKVPRHIRNGAVTRRPECQRWSHVEMFQLETFSFEPFELALCEAVIGAHNHR